MPFAHDPDQIPDKVFVRLPFGTWDEDEGVYLLPVYDVFAREAATQAATIQVAAGVKRGKQLYRDEIQIGPYYRALLEGHVVDADLYFRRGEERIKVRWDAKRHLRTLGRENLTFLINTVLGLSTLPPGGYLATTNAGKELDFRGSDRAAGQAQGAAPERGEPEDAPALAVHAAGAAVPVDVV